ncbi:MULTISPECIES: amidohydrolase [Vagococcus]|uniref:S-adenosylhomocysteine deaminase Methylthioadenosine deaminase n=1 Tax=Vagococcus fluvialis bH819 TaxID=1255619 RepID=A0A1X6WKT9_9ENTE|nr:MULTISPECIES: amidohydrolase [Vagococcus]SLM84943.1 S-adenosylhomocysteine deaminase; Methylthioadenosine deaminase [Vagococcus fluvialis bH819]HCM90482.1 amidohydrolase [Vagococcus sp.]
MLTLIKNAYILTMDDQFTEYEHGFLLIEDSQIKAIGEMSQLSIDFKDINIVDAEGGLLLPGFVNLHTHLGMIPFRSLGDDTPDRLRRFLFPLEQVVTEKLVAASSEYAMAELMLSGTTTFSDMYYFEETVAKSCEKMKMRGFVGQTIIDMPTCDYETPEKAIEGSRLFIEEWKNHELVTPMIAPHATNTNTVEDFKSIVTLSLETGAPIMMHVSEMDYELTEIKEAYNQSPVEFLNELGFLDCHLIMAHGILLSEKEIELLSSANGLVSVAHCIGANTKSAKGVAPIKSLLEQGVCVGLGTDGPSSGNTLDMFTQMKLMANFQKNHLKDRGAFPAKEIIYLATRGGSEALGLENKIGSLEVGKQADLTLVETKSVNMFPIFDPYSAIVYSANASNVESTWINGEQVVSNHKLVRHNIKELRYELDSQMVIFREEVKRIENK